MALAHRSREITHFGPHRADIAWVFPGQGSQEVGMGRDACVRFPEAREIFERADSALGVPLSRLCFEGPEDELKLTVNQQPAILTVSIAYLFAARGRHALLDCVPAFVAGSSLGEYSALIAAGAVSFEDGVRLVRERGRLMHAAGEVNPGTLAAILGMDEPTLGEICDATGAEITNLNGAGQIVIGGTRRTVATAMDLAKARGAKAVELPVSGAFHSSLMRPAVEGLRAALAQTVLQDAAVPIIGNTTAKPIASTEQVTTELISQLYTAVQWEKTIQLMAQLGVTTFVEIGPGKVLSGLIRRIVKGASTQAINGVATISGEA